MGFVKPEGATTADFLTSLTNPEQRIIHHGYEYSVPKSAEDFASKWNNSEEAKDLRNKVDNFNSAHPIVDDIPLDDPEYAGSMNLT